MPTDEVGEPGGAGLSVGKAGDRVHGHRLPSPTAQAADPAGDLDDLGGVRESEPADRDGLEGAQLNSAVRAVAGAVQDGNMLPGQADATVQRVGWLALTVNK